MFVDKVSETAPRISRRPALTAIFGLLIFLTGSFTAEARPPTPQNFRVTARTAYTVTLAWDSPNNNSGSFTYRLSGAYNVGPTVILPQTATSYTVPALVPLNQYWFGIYTQDTAGRTSAQANLNTTTLQDTTPPATAPTVSTTEIGSNYAHLAWTPAQDDGPYLFYEIWVNGNLYTQTGRNVTSYILRFLQPKQTYTVTVRAYDYGQHRGPFSSPLSVTALPPNPNDHTPPTTPTNVAAFSYDSGDTEFQMSWTQATDDFDAQANIRYDVYVNGVLEEITFGSSVLSTVYGEFGENFIEVFATDTAGNRSAPATTTIFL